MNIRPESTIYIVCDADKKNGFGHLLRCLSLARQLTLLNRKIILIGRFSDQAEAFINALQLEYYVSPSSHIASTLKSIPKTAKVILDSYQYHPKDLLELQQYVLIDDFCRLNHYPVEGVINFTINADQYDYCIKGAKTQALGIGYFLPHPFLRRSETEFNSKPNRILIMIGSDDPYNLSPKLLQSLDQLKNQLDIRVLSSKNFTFNSTHDTTIYPIQKNINPHFQWAELLITSGGLAKYEAAFINKPAVVLSQNDGEYSETQDFARAGLCFDFGRAEHFNEKKFINKLNLLISNLKLRYDAFNKSRILFNAHSAKHAAEYVIKCLSKEKS